MRYPESYILWYEDSARVMNRQKRLIVELKEDVATGEVVLDVPEVILNEMGWYEGSFVEWILEGNELLLRDANDVE